MEKIRRWFTRPYPFDGSWKFHIRNSIVGGLFVTLFLAIFRPFGMQIGDGMFWYALGIFAIYGLITAAVLLFLGVIVNRFPRFFNEERWTVGHEILTNVFAILLIASANMIYESTSNGSDFSWPLYFHWIKLTFLVGLGPILITVFWKQNILDRRHSEGAEKLNTHLHPKKIAPKPQLTLSGDNQGEELSFSPSDLLYLEASDNYVRVFFEKNEALEKVLLRSSLKKMEGQLSEHPQFFRCHRTYLVNLDRVEEVSGNAQGYKLHLAGTESLVPVSRSLNEEINRRLS